MSSLEKNGTRTVVSAPVQTGSSTSTLQVNTVNSVAEKPLNKTAPERVSDETLAAIEKDFEISLLPYIPQSKAAQARPVAYFNRDYAPEPESLIAYHVEGEEHTAFQVWRYAYNAALMVLDFTIMVASCSLIFWVNPSVLSTVLGEGVAVDVNILLLILGITWVFSLALCFTYQRHVMGEGYDLYAKIINAIIINFVIVSSLGFLFHLDLPRSLIIVAPILGGVFTIVERWLMRCLLHSFRRKGKMVFPTVIVGSPGKIQYTIEQLEKNPGLGYAPIAVCPIERDAEGGARSYTGNVKKDYYVDASGQHSLRTLKFNAHLPQTARLMKAQVVLVPDVLERQSEVFNAFSLAVEASGLEMAVGATVGDIGGHLLRLHNVSASMPILSARLPQYSYLMRFFKRLMDLAFSVVGIVVSSPIMLATAIAIKREDHGPVFYKQERIGLYGKKFNIYKFRSMRVDADKQDEELANEMGTEHGILFKPKDDPRITKVGKFIRKTSIDEIPQFFNVFLGTMSFVGPRPQQLYEVDEYSAVYSTRLLVKPGLTGPWQISGRSDLSKDQAERLDVNYVENWSLTTDLAIVLKTVVAVLRGEGSY